MKNKVDSALIVIVYECDKKYDSDKIYITEFLNKHFINLIHNSNIKIEHINAGSKSKLFSNKVDKAIENVEKLFLSKKNADKNKIFKIIVADVDNITSNQQHKKEYKEISDNARKNSFEVIWSVKDIENVFLGKSVSDSDKTKEAVSFKRYSKISDININKFKSTKVNSQGFNNAYLVFKKIEKIIFNRTDDKV